MRPLFRYGVRTSARRQATPPLAPPPRGGGFCRRFLQMTSAENAVLRQSRGMGSSGRFAAIRVVPFTGRGRVRNTGQATVFPGHFLKQTANNRAKNTRIIILVRRNLQHWRPDAPGCRRPGKPRSARLCRDRRRAAAGPFRHFFQKMERSVQFRETGQPPVIPAQSPESDIEGSLKNMGQNEGRSWGSTRRSGPGPFLPRHFDRSGASRVVEKSFDSSAPVPALRVRDFSAPPRTGPGRRSK